MPALPFPYTDLLPLPEPSAPLPPLVESITTQCLCCEEGGILVGQGEAWEHYEPCAVCLGTDSTTQYRCEICSRLVSEHELDAANVCVTCFQEGLRLVEEDDDYDRWAKEQIEFGKSVGWL